MTATVAAATTTTTTIAAAALTVSDDKRKEHATMTKIKENNKRRNKNHATHSPFDEWNKLKEYEFENPKTKPFLRLEKCSFNIPAAKEEKTRISQGGTVLVVRII